MAGIPFFVGFFAKFSVLQAVVAAGYIWIAVLAVIMSLIGAFYYLRVVKFMYFDEPADERKISVPLDMSVALGINGLLIVVLGIFPGGLLDWCVFAINSAFLL